MADMADMDSILDQALDDLENVDATMSYMNSASINPLENEQMAGAKPTAHYRAKVQRPNGIGDEPLDPEKFLRDLIEGGEEELDEVDREVKLDEFIKQIQSKFCEDVGDAEAKNPKTKDMGNQVDDEDDVAATLASILEQMTTIDDQDDSYLKEAANFQPDAIVDGMMEQLLSKELMYEPMKQVADLFPAWLEANENILSESDLERYRKQYHCFQELVQQYETDSSDIDALMRMMQDVQEFGQPPQDIINEIAPGLELDADGIPKVNPLEALGDEECTIM